MTRHYWIIDYKLEFRSDFHVGAGITIMGGNIHGLRLGEDGFPYMPSTQVRGLLRLGGRKLMEWKSDLRELYERNFGEENRSPGNFWSFTSATYPRTIFDSGETPETIYSEQSHIKIDENAGVAKNLFSYQKAGWADDRWHWQGRIYSVEPADESDAAFFIACMRAEDRIGHRRTRGYGKVNWTPSRIRSWDPGVPTSLNEDSRSLEEWLSLLLDGRKGASS